MPQGELGPVEIPLGEVDRIIAIGSDGMMNAVAEARHAVLQAVFPPGPPRDRADQLADAMHDEGDLRAVPAAPQRPGDRQRDGRLLLLQPGPGAWTASISRHLRRRLSQNGAQEKLTKLWIDRCLRHLGRRQEAVAAE